jgi:RNA polymerase sigma-70 factor, ECF subfamily
VAWSDGELVLETLAGDREAFSTLVDRHRRTIFAFALQRGFQPAEAEDLAQEVFVKAFRSLAQLQDAESFGGWLYGIASHVFADAVRARKRHPEDVTLEEAPELASDPVATTSDETVEVMRAIGQLPEAQRMVLTLRYLEGLSPKEIAVRMQQPRGTIRSHLHHALSFLQTAFGARAKEKSRSGADR